MRIITKILSLGFCFWLCSSFFNIAFSKGYVNSQRTMFDQIFSEINAKKLYDDPTWLRLLHFRVSSKKSKQSDIITPEFFNSYNESIHRGSTRSITAKDELYETIRAFYNPVSKNANLHSQCRFPARFYWLNNKLQLNNRKLPIVRCPRLEKWAKFKTLDSVSLIMVSGYFGNPASTFGHLLVKLNNSEFRLSSGNLLDQSINYGAKVPDKELLPVYIIKGIFGGYVSSFSDKKFYTQDLVYSKHEFRDMWEYELNLNNEQNRMMVYHIWEMLGMQSTYYFLKENCGYRIAELLELVTGRKLTPDIQPWYLPISVFQGLEEVEHSRYIKKITFLPSSQRKLHQAFNLLNKKEAVTVNKILEKPELLSESIFAEFSAESQSRMIEVMLEYYQYKMTDKDKPKNEYDELKKNKNALVFERLKLPVRRKKEERITPIIISPAKGAKPKLFNIGLVSNEKHDIVYEFGLAAIHYDFLSNSKGALENSELKALDLSLYYDDEQNASIRKFDFISVQKLGLNNTKLFGERDFSWRMSTGFERHDLSCKDCTNFYLKGGIGHAVSPTKSLIAYGMLDAKYSAENNSFEFTPNVGLLITHSDRLKSTFEIGEKINIDSGQKDEHLKIETRYSLSKNNTIRLSIEKFRGEEIRSSFYHHW